MDLAPWRLRCAVVVSALFGGIVSVLADLIQKNEASAILLISRTFTDILQVRDANIPAIILVLLLGVAVAFIFRAETGRSAFYLGASVLAFVITLTPYKLTPGFKGYPNSVEVSVSISTADNGTVTGAVVTLWDSTGRTMLARSRLPANALRFYQGDGTFRLVVEHPGYKAQAVSLDLRESTEPRKSVAVQLEPSGVPLFVQRVLR